MIRKTRRVGRLGGQPKKLRRWATAFAPEASNYDVSKTRADASTSVPFSYRRPAVMSRQRCSASAKDAIPRRPRREKKRGVVGGIS